MNFFDYFEIAAVVLALGLIVFKAAYLRLVRKTTAIVIGRPRAGLAFLFELFAILGVVAWVAEILLRALHARFDFVPAALQFALLDSVILKVAGVVLVSFGLLLDALALLSFGDSWRVGIDEQKSGALVTRGVFAFTRNPIYLAFDLVFTGIFLINGTVIFLVFALLGILVSHQQILREERFLSQQYGAEYRDYCGRTARYFGWM
jgi:protein-S-isoprenylcysteine O-methyltransferase Ste14